MPTASQIKQQIFNQFKGYFWDSTKLMEILDNIVDLAGGSLTQGTAAPSGGADGDFYIQRNIALWYNNAGTWIRLITQYYPVVITGSSAVDIEVNSLDYGGQTIHVEATAPVNFNLNDLSGEKLAFEIHNDSGVDHSVTPVGAGVTLNGSTSAIAIPTGYGPVVVECLDGQKWKMDGYLP